MLHLFFSLSYGSSTCPSLQKNISDFTIELPEAMEGTQIRGTCLHKDQNISLPVYGNCRDGSWQEIDTQYCQHMIEQQISCKNMGISSYITQKTPYSYTTDGGQEVSFETHQSNAQPTKHQIKHLQKFARKNKISLNDAVVQWQSDTKMSPLLQERLACILSTKPKRNVLADHMLDLNCLYKNPSSPSCRGFSDMSYAQQRRYHPSYLSDWNQLEKNEGTSIPSVSNSSWSHWEMRPDKDGRWKHAQLYQYDPSMTWDRNKKTERRTDNIEIQQRRFESNSTYTSILLTSQANCDQYPRKEKQQRICLPSPLKIYTLGSALYDNNNNRTIFAIFGYDTVEIRDLDIEILPHPDLKQWIHPEQCMDTQQNCEQEYKERLTKYLFPDNYKEVFYQSLAKYNSKLTTCKNTKDEEMNISLHAKENNDWWQMYEQNCNFPYTQIYQFFVDHFDMYQYMRFTGNIFFVADNKHVSIANVNTKGYTAEGHFFLQANDFVEVDGVSSQGTSAQQLIDLGIPITDPKRGFSHTQDPDFDPKTTYYMGLGIDILNGRNEPKTLTGYGANCCTTPDNKNQCTEIKNYGGLSELSVFDFTDIGPSPLETILQTDFVYRTHCSRHDDHCTSDQDCLEKKTCTNEKCIQKCDSHTDCDAGSYCVYGACRAHECDTDFISITNSSVFNCTEADLTTIDGKGRRENVDGFSVVSTSGLIFNNHLHNYTCDALSDLAQRRPCARHEKELNQWLRVERNLYENGVLKTEGTSEPENGILYVNNHFHNVRLVDYHRKWRSYYLQNNWFYDTDYDQKSAFFQVNREPTTDHHAPYFGSLVMIGNQVYTQNTIHLWYENTTATPSPNTKIHSQHNAYIGSFYSFYRKDEGKFPLLEPIDKLPLDHYQFQISHRYPWILEDNVIQSKPILVTPDTITPCENPNTPSQIDSKERYRDTYGCFFGEATSVWYPQPQKPQNFPNMNKISMDEHFYVHQNYNGEYRQLETHIGSDENIEEMSE